MKIQQNVPEALWKARGAVGKRGEQEKLETLPLVSGRAKVLGCTCHLSSPPEPSTGPRAFPRADTGRTGGHEGA